MANTNITIDDIAEALGVSKTTVSRAISGKGRISAATTERVQQYIADHNYKPNAVARGLAKQKTSNIGVVCPSDYGLFEMQFFHRCLLGISEVASSRGYDVLLTMIQGNRTDNLKRVVEGQKVDGVILTRTLFEDPLADFLKTTGIPFVVIGSSPDKELVQIDNDHVEACRELTSILIAKGMKRLALVGREEDQVITQSRRKGFFAAYEALGEEPEADLIYLDAYGEQRLSFILDDVMKKGADGLISMDEQIASDVIELCRAKGIRMPDDLRVASFYDSTFLANSAPPVTAVSIDDRKLGTVAAETLLKMLDGEEPGSQFLKNYQIILRESTM